MSSEAQRPGYPEATGPEVQELTRKVDARDIPWYETIAGYLHKIRGSRLSVTDILQDPETGEVSITVSGSKTDIDRYSRVTAVYHEGRQNGLEGSSLGAQLRSALDLQVIRTQG